MAADGYTGKIAEQLIHEPEIQEAIVDYQKLLEKTDTVLHKAQEALKQRVLKVAREKAPKPAVAPSDQQSLFAQASNPDVSLVLEEMHRFVPADDMAAQQLISACRELAPNCSAVQIAEMIRMKGSAARGKDSPVGYLMQCVVSMFRGKTGAKLTQNFDRPQTIAIPVPVPGPDSISDARQWLKDANRSEEDKRLARELLREVGEVA